MNVTRHDERDSSGFLLPGYDKMVFISTRDGSSQLYVLPFQKVVEDPDDPLLAERKKELSADELIEEEEQRRRRIERKIEERRTSSRARRI